MPGYFSGPRIQSFKVGRGPGDWMRSGAMGQAIGDQTAADAKWSVMGGAPGYRFGADVLGQNIARGQQAQERRFAETTDAMEDSLTNPVGSIGKYGLMGIRESWDPFFEALRGKNVNWRGFGFDKQLDVPSGRTYSVEAGEVAPGMRGQGGWYTQDEWRDLTPQDRQNVMGWTQARQALLRRAR